jgi:uncharacterized membrane protein
VARPVDDSSGAGGRSSMNRRQSARSGARLLISVVVGLLAGLPVGATLGWGFLPLVGWVAAAAVFLAWTWTAIWPLDAEDTRRLSQREDPSGPLADVLLLATAVAAMLAVVTVIFRANHASGTAEPLRLALGIASVVGAWAVVHTVFTLKYARLFYRATPGGMSFHQDGTPGYRDFAYVAFTVGMTFQVSDTDITESQIRATVLRHALVSFVFGAVIIAVTINLVAGLSK